MGYETTAIFISRGYQKNRDVGFQCVEATLEMGKICYGHIERLMDKIRITEQDSLMVELKELQEEEKTLFTFDGDYTDDMKDLSKAERDKKIKPYFKRKREFKKKVPCIYYNDFNKESYTDSYGEFLMIAELEDFKRAVFKEQARLINEEKYTHGYRRFDIALRMIEGFENFNHWNKKQIRVVLWGH